MIRVLVVDDSKVVRTLLARALAAEPDIEVVGEAADAYEAREQIVELAPDVITLDVEMPRMNGITFLGRLMKYHPVPVVIFSSVTAPNSEAALQALMLGAVEVVAKPVDGSGTAAVMRQLVRAIRAASCANLDHEPDAGADTKPHIPLYELNASLRSRVKQRMIAIGASTGGPAALERLLSAMPAGAPPVLIVQHMPAGFTDAFARRLDTKSEMNVRQAGDGELVEPGVALLAPGDRHMIVLRRGSELRVGLRDGPPVHHHRPAVDVLFHSIATTVGADAVGVVLTGMGSDGASGMCAMREAGVHTIAQDETSSVVFSMPEQAIRRGGVCEVLPLAHIPAAALNAATSIILGESTTADRKRA
ncbi:MAG: protein-glutamate methylesterase/protein-glutamine glutaminase [Longimicrobiales bacterium]